MDSLVVEVSGAAAEKLRSLADAEKRSESEIIGDALVVYESGKRKLPTGAGNFHSGRSEIVRKAGNCRGMITIVADDDEHLKDFAEYME